MLDSDGDRVIAKYYNGKPKSEQAKFETMLHKKTKSLNFRSDGKYWVNKLSLIMCV